MEGHDAASFHFANIIFCIILFVNSISESDGDSFRLRNILYFAALGL